MSNSLERLVAVTLLATVHARSPWDARDDSDSACEAIACAPRRPRRERTPRAATHTLVRPASSPRRLARPQDTRACTSGDVGVFVLTCCDGSGARTNRRDRPALSRASSPRRPSPRYLRLALAFSSPDRLVRAQTRLPANQPHREMQPPLSVLARFSTHASLRGGLASQNTDDPPSTSRSLDSALTPC